MRTSGSVVHVMVLLAGLQQGLAAADEPVVATAQPWKLRLGPAAGDKGYLSRLAIDGDVLLAFHAKENDFGGRNYQLFQAKQCGSDAAGWQLVDPAPPGELRGMFATAKGALVWSDQGMFRRAGVDAPWTKVGAGIGKLEAAGSIPTEMVSSGTALFAVSGTVVYRSADAGDHWKRFGTLPAKRNNFVFGAIGEVVFFQASASDVHPKSVLMKMAAKNKVTTILEGAFRASAYAGGFAAGPFLVFDSQLSRDNGKSWQPTNLIFTADGQWTGDRVIAAAQTEPVTLSVGNIWTPIDRTGLSAPTGSLMDAIRTTMLCGPDVLVDLDHKLFSLPLTALPSVTK